MSWHRRKRFDRKTLIFIGMMALSLVSLAAPGRGKDKPFTSLIQVAIPPQNAVSEVAHEIASISDKDDDFIEGDKYREIEQENTSLRNKLASLSYHLRLIEEANRELTGLRDLGLTDTYQLIRARVVGEDALSWRSSVLVNRGSLGNVQSGSVVTSDFFTSSAGTDAGVRNGLRVLAGEALVGTVVQVGTHTSRIRLLSDPDSKMAVTIGHMDEETGLTPIGALFWMEGIGRHGIRIIEVDSRYIERDEIRVGDIVMTNGDDERLPIPVTIGTISEITVDPEDGLLCILTVEPAIPPSDIRRVYIIDPSKVTPE